MPPAGTWKRNFCHDDDGDDGTDGRIATMKTTTETCTRHTHTHSSTHTHRCTQTDAQKSREHLTQWAPKRKPLARKVVKQYESYRRQQSYKCEIDSKLNLNINVANCAALENN